jgi:hypothetical protein
LAKSKVDTYIGFCVKARKILLGAGSVDVAKKGVKLILVCSTASENTFKLAIKYKNRFSCPLIICKCGLENAVNKPNCKIAAVMDESLAHAILDNVCDDYELYAGGSN